MLSRSAISRLLTTRRIKRIVCHGMIADQQYMLTAKPHEAMQKPDDLGDGKNYMHETFDPPIWRDRLCAIIQIYSTPEARGLHSL